VFSFLGKLTLWYCLHLLLLSARQQMINISCSLGPQQQTHSNGVQRANRTDRQMDNVPLHRPCSIYYAGSANNNLTNNCHYYYYARLMAFFQDNLGKTAEDR